MIKRFLSGGAAGAGIGVTALIIAVVSSGAGHGTIIPTALLFPLPALFFGSSADLRILGVVLAVVQYPLYGISMAVAKSGLFRWLFLTCLHSTLAILAVLSCLSVQH